METTVLKPVVFAGALVMTPAGSGCERWCWEMVFGPMLAGGGPPVARWR
jgi:hypothetical protein